MSLQRPPTVDLQADGPFEFALELDLPECPVGEQVQGLEHELGATFGFNQEEGDPAVKLFIDTGNKSISMTLRPDDINALKASVDLLHQRVTTDQSTLRADIDQQTDCA